MSMPDISAPTSHDSLLSGPRRITTLKGIALMAGGAALLALAVFVVRFYSHPISDDIAQWGQFGDYVGGLLNPFIAFLTFGAVVFTVLQNESLARSAFEQARAAHTALSFDRSARHLEAALNGMRRALELLGDDNNNRVTWIQAARILAASERIAEGITEPTHRDMLEIELFDLRAEAQRLLGHDNAEKVAAFFYGAPRNMGGGLAVVDLDEAARRSSLPRQNAPGRAGDVHHLDERALFVLWQFAQYPTDFSDPIGDSDFEQLLAEDSIRLHLYPGLKQFLLHRRQYRSVGGRLIEKDMSRSS